MDEKTQSPEGQTALQEKSEETTDSSTTGVQPQNENMLDRADTIRKRLEEANTKTEELVKRQEAVAARMLLAGKTDAGSVAKTPEEEFKEKAKAEADAILRNINPPRVGA